MIHDTQSAKISQKPGGCRIYVIMKTMCPPGYNHNGFMVIYELGHMMYGYTSSLPMNQIMLKKLSKEHNISDHK